MTLNSTYQQIIDQFRANAATATPRELAMYAKAVEAISQREDFDFSASLGDFDDAAIATAAGAGTTELAAVNVARAALNASRAALAASSSARAPALRGSETVHVLYNSFVNDPYRVGRYDTQYVYRTPTWMWHEEATDRLFYASYWPNTSAPQDTYELPTWSYYDFALRAHVGIMAASNHTQYERWRVNPLNGPAEVDSRYMNHVPMLLSKSTDANDVRWCMVSIRTGTPGTVICRVRSWLQTGNAYGSGYGPGAGAGAGKPANVYYYDTTAAGHAYMMYDTTNKRLITKNSDGNNAERRTLYWDVKVDSTAASIWLSDATYDDQARYCDMGMNSIQSAAAPRSKFWVDNVHQVSGADPRAGNPTIAAKHYGSTQYSDAWDFGYHAVDITGATGRHPKVAPACFHFVRKADGTVTWRRIRWFKHTRIRKQWDNSMYPLSDTIHSFLVEDKDGVPLRHAEVVLKPTMPAFNGPWAWRISHILPMFWHPTRDELHCLVRRATQGDNSASPNGFLWSREIYRL